MFLPKAFKNGGLLFSIVAQVTVAVVSSIAMHLLLQCRERFGGGYGDLSGRIGGKKVRTLVLASIAISQIGFVCASIIFVAQNLDSFLKALLNDSSPLSSKALIAIQLAFLIPFALIRNMSKLSGAAFLSSLCILFGLGYIYYFDISTLAKNGINDTVQMFNPRDFTSTIGSVIFAFEGIGLILPVQSSMREPQRFEPLLLVVLVIITTIFTSIGALSYATFGDQTKVEIIDNLPQGDKLVNAVQFLYSLAVLVGTPMQLFPSIRIIEGSLFRGRSGKRNLVNKWMKNTFRAVLVCVCAAVAWLGASNLDKFVALVGSFASIPLLFIYPAFLHWKGVASNQFVKAGDLVLMVAGLMAMVYTSAMTIAHWSDK